MSDRWSRWVLGRCDGGDERQRELSLEWLRPVRDRVLDLAGPLDGKTLLDVGTGDGLIGLEAQRRGAQVIFSDVSPALLEHLRERTTGTFVLTPAEDLAEIEDATVDIVTTRSVLIYVDDKPAAFAAMRRVLRPGGRISLLEPINALMHPEPSGRFFGHNVASVTELAERVAGVFERRPAMSGFDDRDLVRWVEAAGFRHLHVETHHDVTPEVIASLDALLDGAPNPNAPTVREAMAQVLDADEQERFVAALRASVNAGTAVRRTVTAYVTAEV